MDETVEELGRMCAGMGARLERYREIQNGLQFHVVRGTQRVLVNIYTGAKGAKVHVPPDQGPLGEELQSWALRRSVPEIPWATWIGSDESGKGDYFGPLVVAAVAMTRETIEDVLSWGVRDSKEMGDRRILETEAMIVRYCSTHVIRLDPMDYNRFYRQRGNLNSLLGNLHARAVRLVLTPEVEAVVVDRFGRESYLLDELKPGPDLKVIQREKAEDDPAVAAASVLARAEFIRAMRELSEAHRIRLPRGAGEDVLEAAREFAGRHGKAALGEVAKLHFKTTARI
jgi:ribonuclease HIII